MTFREIVFGSDDFRRECELRNAALRVPLGLNLYDENLEPERQQLHFGLFDAAGELVACVIGAPLSPTEAKIRQMAVRGDLQGKGYGRRIMQGLEAQLAHRGFRHLAMHARMTTVGFYAKLGYATVGDEFLEVGIPHVSMEKHIRPSHHERRP